ncbi:MAG: thermonuclease family protein [Carnobacterium sp.]|uniref:thermonuclease family protein n=1 Tax=unclassified Carnobacterium TaxID=257487 RepID=UPI001F2152B8|nr:thermonuclease family protein [Carnobacterium sp. CS13]
MKKIKINKKILSGIIALLIAGIGNYVINEEPSLPYSGQSVENQLSVELERVIDGDTLVFSDGSQEQKLRLLLIDTPESSRTKTGSSQPYGKEAKEFLTTYLEGKNLTIEYEDTHERLDTYDRVLAYLFADGELVQEVLVREGLARVGYEKGNELYLSRLQSAEQTAIEKKVNIWSIEGYVGKYGFNKK